jgi:hypothetical protein
MPCKCMLNVVGLKIVKRIQHVNTIPHTVGNSPVFFLEFFLHKKQGKTSHIKQNL